MSGQGSDLLPQAHFHHVALGHHLPHPLPLCMCMCMCMCMCVCVCVCMSVRVRVCMCVVRARARVHTHAHTHTSKQLTLEFVRVPLRRLEPRRQPRHLTLQPNRALLVLSCQRLPPVQPLSRSPELSAGEEHAVDARRNDPAGPWRARSLTYSDALALPPPPQTNTQIHAQGRARRAPRPAGHHSKLVRAHGCGHAPLAVRVRPSLSP